MASVPYLFQLQDVRQLYKWGSGHLAWEQGTGKTFGSWLFAERAPEARPIVIVCPATVKYNWAREGAEHFGFRSVVLEGTKPGIYVPEADAYILNYDILGKRHSNQSGPGWLPFLKGLKPGIVVLDESQYIANRSAKRTKYAKELCSRVEHVITLSGTPLVNKPAELWPTLNILRPKQFPNFYTFGRHFCAPKLTQWGWDYSGASNLDELNQILTDHKTGCLLRRRKIDVLQDLPEKTRTVIPVPLSSPGEYRTAVKDFLGWLKKNAPGKAERAFRAEALTKLGYLKRLSAELKLPSVMGWVDDYLIGSDGKLIVFGVHQKILLPLYERYQKRAVLIDGGVTGRRRQEAVDRFNLDPRCRILIGNIIAAGTGWSARDCSTTLFAELAWTPGAHAQAMDRTHGISRGRAGYVSESIFLIAKDTIEEKLCEVIHRKQKILNAVLDGGEGDDLNLKEELLNYYLEGAA